MVVVRLLKKSLVIAFAIIIRPLCRVLINLEGDLFRVAPMLNILKQAGDMQCMKLPWTNELPWNAVHRPDFWQRKRMLAAK